MTDPIRFYRATGAFGFLSNLYLCSVTVSDPHSPGNNQLYQSSEHAYQVAKARDPLVAEYIRVAPTPALAAIVGHGIFRYMVVKDWKDRKIERMKACLKAKFDQNPYLKMRLLETEDAELIEESKTDAFWGMGARGTGKNMLGQLLMELRKTYEEQ